VEPARYDRDRAQFILNTLRQARITPEQSFYFDLGLSVDANFQGTDDTTPPFVLLNFIYGVAAYQRWQSCPGISIIEKYFNDHYKKIPVPPPRAPSSERENSFSEQDDSDKDPSYYPPKGRRRPKGTHHTSAREKAMDDLYKISMFIRGITPEEAAIRREKRLEEEEQTAQEAGRRKVMEWIETNRT
jgi:hypothetical protein